MSALSFTVPLNVLNKRNSLSRDEVNYKLNELLYSDGPRVFKLRNADWYFIGEFNGPYELPNRIDSFTIVEVEFLSEYGYKFFDGEKVQSGERFTVETRSQLPTRPLIELTSLTGDDVQVTAVDVDDNTLSIRLSGDLPEKVTIDIDNEEIYETNSGLSVKDRLLRYDSDFENFTIKKDDVVTVNNGTVKMTYKELML